jgi:hypothetical protein
MLLYLDKEGCTTTRDKAVSMLFGVPDWVAEDIREYNTRYCCSRVLRGRRDWGIIRCEGMRGARNFTVETYLCLDGQGKEFVLNRDDVTTAVGPLVCARREFGGKINYNALINNYRHMLDVAKRAKCKGYCVLDEDGRVVVFGDDLYSVVDSWVMLMRNRSITMLSVLV